MNPDAASLPLLRALHQGVFADPAVRVKLDAAFEELAAELRGRAEPPHAARVIPIELFTVGLAPELAGAVRLCRAFLLRRGSRMATPEVHRNSVQRLVSYRGRGRIYADLKRGGRMAGFDAGSGPTRRKRPEDQRGPQDLAPRAVRSPDPGDLAALPIEQCWDIVPAGVWHYPEAGADADWATVTFHSASESEILDELWEAR